MNTNEKLKSMGMPEGISFQNGRFQTNAEMLRNVAPSECGSGGSLFPAGTEFEKDEKEEKEDITDNEVKSGSGGPLYFGGFDPK